MRINVVSEKMSVLIEKRHDEQSTERMDELS